MGGVESLSPKVLLNVPALLCPRRGYLSNQITHFTLMAAQDMREHMLGIGSCWYVPLVILCTAFGVLRPGLPAASNSAFRLDKLTTWWHRGPRLSVISLKVYVCMLLLIELLGASVPENAVLALPDILRRVKRHPEFSPHSASVALSRTKSCRGPGLLSRQLCEESTRVVYQGPAGIFDGTSAGRKAIFDATAHVPVHARSGRQHCRRLCLLSRCASCITAWGLVHLPGRTKHLENDVNGMLYLGSGHVLLPW